MQRTVKSCWQHWLFHARMKNHRAFDLNTSRATCCANSRLSPIVFVSYHFDFMAVRPPRTYHAINSHPGVDNNSTRFLALPLCIESCNEIVNIMRRWPNEFLRFLRSLFFLDQGWTSWIENVERIGIEKEEEKKARVRRLFAKNTYVFICLCFLPSVFSWPRLNKLDGKCRTDKDRRRKGEGIARVRRLFAKYVFSSYVKL